MRTISFMLASAGLFVSVPVAAQEIGEGTTRPAPYGLPMDTHSAQSRLDTKMTGDWGGLRTRLADEGVDLTISYGSETAWNPEGGRRERVRETGQFVFGTTVDTGKLFGLKGGKLQGTITYRRGKDLGAAAGLDVLQQVQEVYGRGQTWRLTQLWYQQTVAGGHVDVKAGRLTMGEDFSAFSCHLMNLSFCGSPVGNLAGDYWYNWPISQWAVRARVKNDKLYAMVGVYEVNPRNLDNAFFLGRFHGATGAMVPFEVGYTPQFGAHRLPGSYKFGGWINSANADDVLLDLDRRPQAITGVAPLRRDSRYGVYMQLQQQLNGTIVDTPAGPEPGYGLVAFLNVTPPDRRTTTTDNQIAAGLFYRGLFSFRPHDDIDLAIARTNVNSRSTEIRQAGAARPNAEYAAEMGYGLHVTGWLSLHPNVQYIIDPGGYSEADDVVVLGLKATADF